MIEKRFQKEYQKNLEEWNALKQLSPKVRRMVLLALDTTEDRYAFYYKLLELMGKEEGPKVYQKVKSHLHEIGR